MANLASVVGQLRKERDRAAQDVHRLDAAIAALGVTRYGKRRGTRELSAAARRKIAAAQRARWAKVRAGKKKGSDSAAAK